MSEPTDTGRALLAPMRDNFGLPVTHEGQLHHSWLHRERNFDHPIVGYCPEAQRVKRIEAEAAEAEARVREALAVLYADARDANREAMWRYGVRHSLTIIERALASEVSDEPA